MLTKDRRKLIIPFLAPGLILYLLFFIYPGIQGIYLSLFDSPGFGLPKKFIGLLNFQQLVVDDRFITALKTTMFILFIGGLAVFVLGFGFTALLNSGIRGKKFFRAVLFFPNVVAPIALTTFWSMIYNSRFGVLNSFLKLVGLKNLILPWTDSDHILGAVTIALIWLYTGYFMVILLAGADKIPQEIYDAARVDGSNSLQVFIQITLPLMWDIVGIALVLWMITAIKQFEIIYSFGSGIQVNPATWTLPIYLEIEGFGLRDPIFRLGYASAIGVVILVVIVVLAVVMRRFLHREVTQF
jgi:ABC-type sugar transport system permease subunit